MEIKYAKAGDAWVHDQTALVIGPKCEDDYTGNWFCVHCAMSVQNNWMRDSHAEENPSHIFAWQCHGHGIEEP